MNDKHLVIICLTIIAVTLLVKVDLTKLEIPELYNIFLLLSNIVSGLLGIATGHAIDKFSKNIFEKFKKKNE